ncbi:MAG: redoxin domain-containing protein [Candidatus Magasanikbacteria bacterium]|nr:redoxin domain-containing protein [Candidatus Magasanikbacteria bacterium]
MNGKIINNNDRIILAGIASFTIIVVAAIWFLSNTASRTGNSTAAAPEPPDSMASHHTGGGRAATAILDALVGKTVPDFTLTDRDGKAYSKDNLQGKKVVLFFNEGLMCYPACWNQIAELASDSRLNNKDTIVLSVVVDPVKEWQRAVDKMPELARATVVFDTNREVSGKLGLLTTPSSMHYGSLPGHSYVIIDRDGTVRHVYDDPTMAIHNDQLIDELAKLP